MEISGVAIDLKTLFPIVHIALAVSIAYILTHRFRTRRDIRDIAFKNLADIKQNKDFSHLEKKEEHFDEILYLETLGLLSDDKEETRSQLNKINNEKHLRSLKHFRIWFLNSLDRKINAYFLLPLVSALYLFFILTTSNIITIELASDKERIIAIAIMIFGISYIFIFGYWVWAASETIRMVRTNVHDARKKICETLCADYFLPSNFSAKREQIHS